MLNPTPDFPLVRCVCCSNWFNPLSEGTFGECCSLECSITAQNSYREFGELRRCRNCRSEFVAYEKHHRLCGNCLHRGKAVCA